MENKFKEYFKILVSVFLIFTLSSFFVEGMNSEYIVLKYWTFNRTSAILGATNVLDIQVDFTRW